MPRLLLFALAVALAACGSGTDAPTDATDVAAVAETSATPDLAPATDADAADQSPDAAADEPAPSDAVAEADPVPAAGPPDDKEVLPAFAGEGFAVVNDTGMTLITLHIAGCNESEGNDWAEMELWSTDYLGAEVLFAGDTWEVDVLPGCYVVRSEWEDGTVGSERVESTAGMTHYLTLG